MSYGTHNRAGDITYVQTGPLTIEMTITTYTRASSTSADRDSLEFFWGDGTSQFVKRTNGNGKGVNIGQDIRLNIYKLSHTYPGRSTYTMGFEDPNRVGGILNVNWPNSIDIKFFLSTTITFLDPQFDGTNSSAQLLQPPLDIACVGKRFVHNPNAYDPDGDSLSYELVTPLSSATEVVPNYVFPDKIGPGPNNVIFLNNETGEFLWDSPQLPGDYNIAIKINEWRNGVVISSIIRDMQITVTQCDNDPPIIENIDELCVIAGEIISLDFVVDDPNEGQLVIFSATGAPFLFENDNAELSQDSIYLSPAYTATFDWKTTCNHISDKFYQVVLKAEDDFFNDTLGLVALKTVRIKVIGPPPENLTSETQSGDIRLTWDAPYTCEVTDNEFFRGFSVWRKNGSSSQILDSCTVGLEKLGYERIEFNTKDIVAGKYTYLDNTVENGVTYCYRIQAEFAKVSATGIAYNRIASLPSKEVCQQLSRNLPLITRATVTTTDNTTGEVELRWTKPLADDLDTLMNPGPYRYELYYSDDGGATSSILDDFTVLTVHFNTNIDTIYNHGGLDTRTLQHTYFMKFYTANGFLDNSSSASTIYLKTSPSDMVMNLSWQEDVPWSNSIYYIYRAPQFGGLYTLIDSTRERTYTDTDLENGINYCYYIQSHGSYAITSVLDIIINDSQIACALAIDNIPPCPPTLTVSNVCDDENPTDFTDLFNLLEYTNPNQQCSDTDDTEGYYIYFAPFEGESLVKVDSVDGADQREYEHMPPTGISGCYAVTAYDSNRNESELSNIVCVDNCPLYKLPNTFTPNGDGSNDLFTPIVNRFIEFVEFDVYNEWGNKVWSTSDDKLLWDGTDYGGVELPEGTYYYTCGVYERRVQGVSLSTELLRGHINILK